MQHASSASSSKAPPGTIDFLPDLFARAHAAHPDFPLDHVIIQSLLLCLIAQPRSPSVSAKQAYDSAVRPGLHLILRTREEDVGVVVNLVALTLQHVLGVSTHKHKIGARTDPPSRQRRRRSTGATHTSSHAPATDDPDAFLRALFFRRGPHPSFSSHRSSTPRPRSGISLDATPKSGTIPLGGQAKSPRGVAHVPHRSASYTAAPSTDGEDEYFDASSLASSRRPLLPGHTPASTMRSRGSSRARPSAHRLRTDPLPLSSLFTLPGSEGHDSPASTPATTTTTDSLRPQKSGPGSERASDPGQPVSAMPRAVVVSGLEHTTPPAQRALMRVLTERRLIMSGYGGDQEGDSTEREVDVDVEDGTWNLPDGFVMVYVCKWDPHERPPIQRGLLDKFSMSSEILLPAAVRQHYLAYRAAHSTPTPRGTPIPSPLALPHSIHSFFPNPSHSPARRPAPLPVPTPQLPPVLSSSELADLRMLARPYPTTGPIFYPSVHATLQPMPVLPLPPQPPPYAALHPSLEIYLLDLFAATRHHPMLEGTLLTQRAHADAEALARAFRVLNGDTLGTALIVQEAQLGGDRETAAAESFDDASWTEDGWRSVESLTRSGRIKAEFLGVDNGVRVRVNGDSVHSDGASALSGMYGDGGGSGASPPEAQALAMARAWPEVWDVSEEDVARVFPRAVSHRLRVRDGPDDEVLGSVMWPAVPPEGAAAAAAMCGAVVDGSPQPDGLGRPMGWDRKTVKEILVRVLAEV
ncbi:uncharacterized protein TRAVEDRAFT_68983 [Trametes versicolor FP-101664 SS1]|uniref:uncharacterized protein n=1 Tax=Trametes versicolor (strain FP-101664) TaxID=717944 RepID=UPI00046231E5|nr:uncharacterized protein TRAVEDRAFT_68983 [Trametes versicolor FP-101664 SS1]EIW62645.1 hypothetical protein TRAVEDRAFT_68983 [Trametes versicolor FP-101664 SS1]